MRDERRHWITMTLILLGAGLVATACVPLDTAEPTNSTSPPATISPTPIVESSVQPTPADAWSTCTDPVITKGKTSKEGWELIAVAERITTPGSETNTVLLDKPVTASLTFDPKIPEATRFADPISQALENSVSQTTSGVESIWDGLHSVKKPQQVLGYRAIDRRTISFTMTCADQSVQGTAHTWNVIESGLLECALKATEPANSPADLARKDYCGPR